MVILTLLVVLLSAAMATLRYSAARQEEKRAGLEDDFTIWMKVSDLRGIKSDGLNIDSHYVRMFLTDDYNDLSPFVTDVCLKATTTLHNYDNARLVGITRREAEKLLSPESGGTVSFREGWSWADFLDNKAVCLGEYPYGADAETMILHYGDGKSAEFTIIGAIQQPDSEHIYFFCPWVFLVEEGNERSEVLRATVADNRRLGEFKETAQKYFVAVNINNTFSFQYHFALTIFDSAYTQSHKSASRNIELLKVALPVFLTAVFAVGFFAGFLVLRNRKREYALMRAMGASKTAAVTLLAVEYMIVCAVGMIIYAVLMLFTEPLTYAGVFLPATALCFMAGIMACILVETRNSVLKSLQFKE
jgi:hypothetical protein